MRRLWVGLESDSPIVVSLNAKRAEYYGELTLFTCLRDSESSFLCRSHPFLRRLKGDDILSLGKRSSGASRTTHKKPDKVKNKDIMLSKTTCAWNL